MGVLIPYLTLFFSHDALFGHIDLRRSERMQESGPNSHEGRKKLKNKDEL